MESVFFAEVGTRDDNGKRVWYVVAVERAGGDWKLAYVTFGGYKSAPPLRAYTRSDNYTVPVTSASTTRMQHLVGLSVKYARTHNPLVDHTSYGAVIHTRFLVRPSKDGSFGLSLASGDVLSCYTLHAIDTYTVSSQGLQQGASRTQWGHLLRPGIYRSITIDTARPVCVAGTGVGSKAVVVRLSYDPRVVAESGVRL